jgi:hypothetical protein
MKKLTTLLAALVVFCSIGYGWDNSSCNYRMSLNYSSSWSGESLTDFPLPVVLNGSVIDYGKTSFDDLQFYSDEGKRLPKELEVWNSSGNSAVFYRDNITGAEDYAMLYYNCTSPVANAYTDVWNPDYYLGVWHMAGSPNDSSYYGWNGSVTGTLAPTEGLIGKAYKWASRHIGYITLNASVLGTISGPITLTSMVYYTNGVGYQNFILTSQGAGDDGSPPVTYWLSNWESNSKFRYTYTHSNNYASLDWSTAIQNNVWYSYLVSKETEGGLTTMMVNGENISSPSYTADLTSPPHDILIGDLKGALGWNLGGMVGYIDELRIENVSRSVKWLNATQLSLFNRFLTYGSEETAPPVAWLHVYDIFPPNASTNTSSDIYLGYRVNTSSNGSLSCSLQVDGSQVQTDGGVLNWTISTFFLSALPNATYSWQVNCSDDSLSGTSPLWQVTIAAAYPVWVSLDYHQPLSLLQPTSHVGYFEIGAVSSHTIDYCFINLSGSLYYNTSIVNNNTNVSWTFAMANGSYPFYMACNNSAGGYGQTPTNTLIIAVPNFTSAYVPVTNASCYIRTDKDSYLPGESIMVTAESPNDTIVSLSDFTTLLDSWSIVGGGMTSFKTSYGPNTASLVLVNGCGSMVTFKVTADTSFNWLPLLALAIAIVAVIVIRIFMW